MAGEDEVVWCSKCPIGYPNDSATIEEQFGYKAPGTPYKTCKSCRAQMVVWSKASYERNREAKLAYRKEYRARHPEKTKEYYEKNKESIRTYVKAYQEAHREEINERARTKVACGLCGREVGRYNLKNHQATRLCEKNRPAPEQAP